MSSKEGEFPLLPEMKITGHIYTSVPSPFIFSFTAIKKHIINHSVMYTSSYALTSALKFRIISRKCKISYFLLLWEELTFLEPNFKPSSPRK